MTDESLTRQGFILAGRTPAERLARGLFAALDMDWSATGGQCERSWRLADPSDKEDMSDLAETLGQLGFGYLPDTRYTLLNEVAERVLECVGCSTEPLIECPQHGDTLAQQIPADIARQIRATIPVLNPDGTYSALD